MGNYKFIKSQIKHCLTVEYNNSLFGFLWHIASPLVTMFIYTVIFTKIMGAKLSIENTIFSYSIYLISGLILWNLFVEIFSGVKNIFHENSSTIKKINFPKSLLFAVVIGKSLVNFIIFITLFFIYLIFLGEFSIFKSLMILPLVLLVIFFSTSLGLVVACLSFIMRDIGHFFNTFLGLWFWATPIVYSIAILPESLIPYIKLNPITSITSASQSIFLQLDFSYASLFYPFSLSILFLIVGIYFFRNFEHFIMDNL
jgi:lipopolysaccharide transport system permease protein